MEEKEIKLKYAQKLREEVNNIVISVVKPKREEYIKTLNEIADLLCPFNVNEIIILPNGKKGIINKISYLSLDYEFQESIRESMGYPGLQEDDFDYLFSYVVDKKKFAITWQISGFRLKKDAKPGLISFKELSPIYHNIDAHKKEIKNKPLSNFMDLNSMAILDASNPNELISNIINNDTM